MASIYTLYVYIAMYMAYLAEAKNHKCHRSKDRSIRKAVCLGLLSQYVICLYGIYGVYIRMQFLIIIYGLNNPTYINKNVIRCGVKICMHVYAYGKCITKHIRQP
jgi:hypothetical protein